MTTTDQDTAVAGNLDRLLVSVLDSGLRGQLDRALANGAPASSLLAVVRRWCDTTPSRWDPLLIEQVEAYLARRANEAAAARFRLRIAAGTGSDLSDEAARVADPRYTPTLAEAMRHPDEFVSAMTETVVVHHGLPPGLGRKGHGAK